MKKIWSKESDSAGYNDKWKVATMIKRVQRRKKDINARYNDDRGVQWWRNYRMNDEEITEIIEITDITEIIEWMMNK